MRVFTKRLAICFASPAILISAEASTVTHKIDFKPREIAKTTPTHAVFLKCDLNENTVTQSKGAILELPKDLKNTKKDFAIVTGHGLKTDADCYVSDFQGNSRKVLTKTYAKNYKSGTETDWAIVSFKRIKGAHLKRYNLESYLETPSSLHNAPISFARARGLPQNSQNCKVAVVALKTQDKSKPIFSHTCQAIPGQSGSPLTQVSDGQDHLIGLHLGYLWMLRSPLTGKPGQVNIMRPYDKQKADEIRQTLSQNK
jgi:hypothetical protein